ncbi:hypothetical protein [uncultured Desulfosarcina sp.]|uniref:hypothetical protein n=1 Tax=uncultured Desulfosarcina sp. TaxID=218289 RepID=UPI0029C94BAF|nr:hypothetical protein [uncultured Desulfosarcina sp.]
MKNLSVKTHTTIKVLRFLLAPEDSSATSSGNAPPYGVTPWTQAKTLIWFVFSVLAALTVGQL